MPRRFLAILAVIVFAASCGGGSRFFPIPPKPKIEVVPNGRTRCLDRAGGAVAHRACAGRQSDSQRVNALSVADAVLEAQVRQVQDQVALRELLEAAALINLSKRPVVPRVVIGTAIQASTLPIDGDYHAWPDWKLWHATGLCEQRGEGQYDTNGDGIAWHGSPAGGSPSSGYPGGLGLGVPFWNEFHAAAGVAQTNGAYATPGEQIRVARVGSHNGTRMGGWSSWGSGCIQRTMATL